MGLDRVRKYKRCSFCMRHGKIQHMPDEQDVRLKAHTLFIGRVLYYAIFQSNEHHLHILRFATGVVLCSPCSDLVFVFTFVYMGTLSDTIGLESSTNQYFYFDSLHAHNMSKRP